MMLSLQRLMQLLPIALLLPLPALAFGGPSLHPENSSYSIGTLPTLGGRNACAIDIDAAGRIVGWADNADGESHATIWIDGKANDLGTLGGAESMATAIGLSVVIVGEAETAAGERHAAVWRDGVISDLGTLGGPESSATSVNTAGVVAGWALDEDHHMRAVTWSDGVIRDLGTLGGTESLAYDIDDAGRVVGTAATPVEVRHAVIWAEGVAADLGTLSGPESFATAISNSGTFVGMADRSDRLSQAVRWENGTLAALSNLGKDGWSMAIDVNDEGVIAGTSSYTAGARGVPVVWTGGEITALPALGSAGSATGVNAAGTLVGWADDADLDRYAVVWIPAPARFATPVATPSGVAQATAVGGGSTKLVICLCY